MSKVLLSDVCEIASGQSAPQEKKVFCDDGYPFIRAGSLESLIEGNCNTEKILPQVGKELRLRLFPPNTILFAKSGMSAKIGRVYKIDKPSYVVSHLAAIIPNEDKIDPDWLKRWFEYNPPSILIPNEAYPSIKLSEIAKLQLELESINRQKEISSLLNIADNLCQKRKEQLALLDDYLKSVFLDMFGDPVMNNKSCKMMKFSDVGTLDRGMSKYRPRNAPELLGGPYPLIQTGDVSNSGGYITSYKSTYSEAGLKQSKLWPVGTLCITIAANIAKTGILTFESCFPDSVVGFAPNNLVRTEYVQFWMSFLQKILEEKAPESAQKNINLAILRELDIPVPPIENQDKFVKIINKVEQAKQKMRASLDEMDNHFNALMQRYFG